MKLHCAECGEYMEKTIEIENPSKFNGVHIYLTHPDYPESDCFWGGHSVISTEKRPLLVQPHSNR